MTDPAFMTEKVLGDVLAEFEWLAPYTLNDEDLPDGIDVAFPRCSLFFSEDWTGCVHVAFSAEHTGLDEAVDMRGVRKVLGGGKTPGLIKDIAGPGSSKKVQNQIRDLAKILLNEFASSLVGEYAWIPAYTSVLAREKQSREGGQGA